METILEKETKLEARNESFVYNLLFEEMQSQALKSKNFIDLYKSINKEITGSNIGKLLRAFGFLNSKEVVQYDSRISEDKQKQKEFEESPQFLKMLSYFQTKYPGYLFVTADCVKLICDKHKIGYEKAKYYEGSISEQTLKILREFKILKRDSCVDFHYYWHSNYGIHPEVEFCNNSTIRDLEKLLKKKFEKFKDYEAKESELEIIAPKKLVGRNDHYADDLKFEGYLLLQPVCFEFKKGYLIK